MTFLRRTLKPDSKWYFFSLSFSGGPPFHPASEMGCRHRQKTGFSRMWVIWPQKHENVFYESPESESALFCISPPPGHLGGPYLKATAQTLKSSRFGRMQVWLVPPPRLGRPSLELKDGQLRSAHPTECFTGGPYRRASRARGVSVP